MRERKPSRFYRKNLIDNQQKKLKLKNKPQLQQKKRKIFKRDLSIFNLKNQMKKNLMMKIIEIYYLFPSR